MKETILGGNGANQRARNRSKHPNVRQIICKEDAGIGAHCGAR